MKQVATDPQAVQHLDALAREVQEEAARYPRAR